MIARGHGHAETTEGSARDAERRYKNQGKTFFMGLLPKSVNETLARRIPGGLGKIRHRAGWDESSVQIDFLLKQRGRSSSGEVSKVPNQVRLIVIAGMNRCIRPV
jgi:hypothetical protein